MLRLEDADFSGVALREIVAEENRQILERLLARARRAGRASEQTVLRREFSGDGDAAAADDAHLPVALAAAVDPGWSMMVWTGALFIGSDLVVGQFIEPLVYGHSTGLSPVSLKICPS